jgi:hypothetical protein
MEAAVPTAEHDDRFKASKTEYHLSDGQGFKNPWSSYRNVTNGEFAKAWVR